VTQWVCPSPLVLSFYLARGESRLIEFVFCFFFSHFLSWDFHAMVGGVWYLRSVFFLVAP